MSTGSELGNNALWASTKQHAQAISPSAGAIMPPGDRAAPANVSSLPATPSSSSSLSPANSDTLPRTSPKSPSDLPVSHRAPPRVAISNNNTGLAFPPSLRSTSLTLTAMGQSPSQYNSHTRPIPSLPPPPPIPAKGLSAVAGGVKRAFAGRRKKSQDVRERARSRDDLVPSTSQHQHQEQQRRHGQSHPIYPPHQLQRIEAISSSSSSPAQMSRYESTPQSGPSQGRASTKHLAQFATQVFGGSGKRNANARPGSMDQPPVPPPKLGLDSVAMLRPKTADPTNRSSIIPISPGISSAVNYMRISEEQRERDEALERRQEKENEVKREVERERERERVRVREKEREKEKEKQREEERQNLARKEQESKENQPAREAGEGGGVGEADRTVVVDKRDLKDSWRMSDSTISHVTIRPGAGNSRPSRPVSTAESLQSNHTIVPVNKRLSALITDADFGMAEEDDSDKYTEEEGQEDRHNNHTIPDSDLNTTLSITDSPKSSPTASVKSRPNRRSMSLNITSHSAFSKPNLPPTPSSAELRSPPHSMSEGKPAAPTRSPSLSKETPTLSRTTVTATGFISASSSGPQSAGHNIRGRLAAWTAVSHSSSASAAQRHPAPPSLSASRTERSLPALPPHKRSHPHLNTTQPPSKQSEHPNIHPQLSLPMHVHHNSGTSFRQTAISMTSGFAPAAGLAKRAVEKIWGGISSGSSNSNHGHSHSGYSSSSSIGTGTGTPPSSYTSSHHHNLSSSHGHRRTSQDGAGNDLALGRTPSNQSSAAGQHIHQSEKKSRLRRTPNAPSSSSIMTTSSVSISDSEPFMGAGPTLGKQLRGPLRAKVGVVFGKDLRTVVRETGVGVGKPKAWGGRWRNWDEDVDGAEDGGEAENEGLRRANMRREQLKALEERKLPALVVRCAQHLLLWGIQEEGLFRVSGRPSHVTKLRAEFDTGADFDMTECAPGDLDPHAVASVFKAFLRELPEPLLTHALSPYFDAAMNQESVANSNAPDPPSASRTQSRAPGLPSSPRSAGMPLPALRKPPSLSTLAMPSFTGMRPPSRSLLNAFQSLISQLPEESRDLLRTVTELIMATAQGCKATKMPLSNLLLVFCPSLNMNPSLLRVLCEAKGIWEEAPVMLIQRTDADEVIDIRAESVDEGEEEFLDARDGTEEDDGEREETTSDDLSSSVDYQASIEDAKVAVVSRSRLMGPRKPVSTMYLDADESSLLSQPVSPNSEPIPGSLSSKDDGSSYMSDQDSASPHYVDLHSHSASPPLLSSSAESDTSTSTTNSSAHSSFSHLPIVPTEDDLFAKKAEDQGKSMPLIAEPPMELSPTTPRRLTISNPIPITLPVQFPTSSTDAAHSRTSPAASGNRRSIPVLSLPNFSPTIFPLDGSRTSDSPSPSSMLGKRLKKPSLQFLFSKQSASSLRNATSSPVLIGRPLISGPYLQTSRSASDSSVSTPLSAVTAPQTSTFTLPPKLDTPIDSSSLKMGMGIDELGSPTDRDLLAPDEQEPPPRTSISSGRSLPGVVSPTKSRTSLSSTGHRQTPIADRFNRSPSPAASSAHSLVSPKDSEVLSTQLRPYPARAQGAESTCSIASSNHLGILDDDEEQEDWTATVLMAADVDGHWMVPPSAIQ